MTDEERRLEKMVNISILERRIRKVQHPLHMIASLMTAGLWVFVWLYDVFKTRRENRVTRERIEAIRYDLQYRPVNGDMGCPDTMTYYV